MDSRSPYGRSPQPYMGQGSPYAPVPVIPAGSPYAQQMRAQSMSSNFPGSPTPVHHSPMPNVASGYPVPSTPVPMAYPTSQPMAYPTSQPMSRPMSEQPMSRPMSNRPASQQPMQQPFSQQPIIQQPMSPVVPQSRPPMSQALVPSPARGSHTRHSADRPSRKPTTSHELVIKSNRPLVVYAPEAPPKPRLVSQKSSSKTDSSGQSKTTREETYAVGKKTFVVKEKNEVTIKEKKGGLLKRIRDS